MVTASPSRQYQYHVGGTVPADASSYVEREANIQLYNTLKALKFCYVFNSRQKGKSSIEGWARKRLEQDGFTCAFLDISQVGTQSVKEEQWYVSVLQFLAKELGLNIHAPQWWKQQGNLTSSACLSRFFEEIVLTQIQGNISITIDEIDSVFGLKFSTDDFFAFIRSCYNQRSNKPAYERLTFLLIGVATPSDLVENKHRTPFNLGHAINLTGFNVSEIQPLARGLEGLVANPKIVLEEILAWTNGHPFLTQKICNLIYEKEIIIQAGDEKKHVQDIIQQSIIVNWEEQDNPEHLRTIEQRIIHSSANDTEKASRLLTIYQEIFDKKRIVIDNTPEQSELMLSGLVVKEPGFICIANRIYETIFNQRWINKSLASLKPYTEAMRAWKTSGYKDISRLLNGKALQDALIWVQDKALTPLDKKFLNESKKYSQQLFLEEAQNLTTENRLKCDYILKSNDKKFAKIAKSPEDLISEIYQWSGDNSSLLVMIATLIQQQYPSISKGEERNTVKDIVESSVINGWEDQASLPSPLIELRNKLFKHPRKNELLNLYSRILKNKPVDINDRPDLRALLQIGLISIDKDQKKLKVPNKIYALCFDQEWVRNELTKVEHGFVINNRYEVTRQLSQRDLITTYLVKDKYNPDPRTREYLAKQFVPNQYLEGRDELMDEIRTSFLSIVQILGEVSKIDQIPGFPVTFEENKAFYIIQEYVRGKTLDRDMPVGESLAQKPVTNLLIEVLEVLHLAHQAGLKHLNLHPGNLMRRYSDHKLMLIDFALFQAIAAQVIQTAPSGEAIRIGTPGYEPLEQIDGQADFASDIYAVGMIGVQALTGVHPTKLPDDKHTGAKIWRYEAPSKGKQVIDERLVKIIDAMIHPDPFYRCPTALDALKSLKKLRQMWGKEQAKQQEKERQESEAKKTRQKEEQKRAKRHKQQRLAKWVISSLLISGVATGALFTYQANNIAENAKQREACEKQLESTEINLANIELVRLALDVRENCSASLNTSDTLSESSIYVRRGQSYLVLWNHENRLGNYKSAQDSLASASVDFREAAKGNNGAASFYSGLTQAIQKSEEETSSDLNENSYQKIIHASYDQAVNYYTESLDILGEEQEAAIPPILVKLAFFLINQDSAESEVLRQANQLFKKSLGYSIDAAIDKQDLSMTDLTLIYNQGVINARASASSDAIALFDKIIATLKLRQKLSQNPDANSEQSVITREENKLLANTYQSLGFTYFFLGFQDSENFKKAEENFSASLKIQDSEEFKEGQDAFEQEQAKEQLATIKSVQAALESCSTSPVPDVPSIPQASANATAPNEESASTVSANVQRQNNCDRIKSPQEQLKEDPNVIFPIVPVYKCTENPALAIAEQALIDRGLEPASTKLCR